MLTNFVKCLPLIIFMTLCNNFHQRFAVYEPPFNPCSGVARLVTHARSGQCPASSLPFSFLVISFLIADRTWSNTSFSLLLIRVHIALQLYIFVCIICSRSCAICVWICGFAYIGAWVCDELQIVESRVVWCRVTRWSPCNFCLLLQNLLFRATAAAVARRVGNVHSFVRTDAVVERHDVSEHQWWARKSYLY